MRDSSAPEPDGPRKDLRGQLRPPMTCTQLQKCAEMIARYRRPGRRDDEAGLGAPVDPRKPNTLSGGATAPLEFD
jgi:hypothetical protein